jgi:polyphenol oxidase
MIRSAIEPLGAKLSRLTGDPELYQIELPDDARGFKHALSARGGGISSGGCASLNLSFVRADSAANVRENRRRVFERLGLSPDRVIFQEQVHGDRIQVIDRHWPAKSGFEAATAVPGTDAMISVEPGFCLAARAADCLLIGLHDPVTGAVAAIHAGWRSTLKGIAAKTVALMQSATGGNPAGYVALFSPSAGPCCYQVGPEFPGLIAASEWASPRHLITRNPPGNESGEMTASRTLFFDLWATNRDQLTRAGLSPKNIHNPRECTICSLPRFFSYRVTGTEVGGHALMIWS